MLVIHQDHFQAENIVRRQGVVFNVARVDGHDAANEQAICMDGSGVIRSSIPNGGGDGEVGHAGFKQISPIVETDVEDLIEHDRRVIASAIGKEPPERLRCQCPSSVPVAVFEPVDLIGRFRQDDDQRQLFIG